MGKQAGEKGKDASKQSVADWEAERHYPKADQLRVLCLKLGVSADYLVFGDLQQQAKLAHAQNAIAALTPEQRKALLDMMRKPGLGDEEVERRIPITTTLKSKAQS